MSFELRANTAEELAEKIDEVKNLFEEAGFIIERYPCVPVSPYFSLQEIFLAFKKTGDYCFWHAGNTGDGDSVFSYCELEKWDREENKTRRRESFNSYAKWKKEWELFEAHAEKEGE